LANFLQPIADLKLPVAGSVSDKQRGLVPAVGVVFPQAKDGFCQVHYLKNAAEPIAEAHEIMQVTLRQEARRALGDLIRQVQVESSGVLTVTGLVPSPVPEAAPVEPMQTRAQVGETIRQDLQRRIRYLLTLKGRPPFRLAGIEMFVRLTAVPDCLGHLIVAQPDSRLSQLHQGLQNALQASQSDYAILHQAAHWLAEIAALLDPQDKPVRTGTHVKQAWLDFLHQIQGERQTNPMWQGFFQTLQKTTLSSAPGLFHCDDVPGLPRTRIMIHTAPHWEDQVYSLFLLFDGDQKVFVPCI
jgi:hypothetical protein